MISFACARCGMKLKVKDEFAGRSSRCPTCKQPLVVPPPDKTELQVNPGALEGSSSSFQEAGGGGGVTIERDADTHKGHKAVREILAQRPQGKERYVLESEIARGGMGAVLRAIDCDIRREVAIKYLLDQHDPRKKLRFVEEAQITGQLEHPNIVPIHELGVDSQKRLYFTMKMVRGRSLAQVFEQLRLNSKPAEKEYSLARLLNVLVSACHALAYAHSRGVVHRDLKPANIMIGDFGEVYVMDWGLAKVGAADGSADVDYVAPANPSAIVGQGSSSSGSGSGSGKIATSRLAETDLTQEGAVIGTPAYMPPEQAAGKLQAIDQRSDVYSLGALLYEMLVLQAPIERDGGYMTMLLRAIEGHVVPPEQRKTPWARSRRVPRELSAIAMKALAKRQEDRYPTVHALRRDVELYLEGRSVSAKEDTRWELFTKFVRRNKAFSAATCAGLLLLTLVLWFSFRINYQARVRAEQNYTSFVKEQDDKRERGKRSAPLFVRDARLSAEHKHLDYALDQVNVALDYDPDLADALLVKGQIYVVRKDFAAARRELDAYLQRRPNDKDAVRLRELCNGRPGDSSVAAAMVDVFVHQGAFGLAEQMDVDKGRLFQLYRQRLNAAWPGNLGNKLTLTEGKCQLDLTFCPQVKDLSPLEGMPLDRLQLNQSGGVWDLRPLAGMPLSYLELNNCGQVRDLTPLAGMPLTRLSLHGCREVRDLSPLKGMPLTSLSLRECSHVSDLSSLRGLPLTSLDLGGCGQVSDLTPLQSMPLTGLNLGGTNVRDLTPLRSLRLSWLNLQQCRNVRDLEALRNGLKQLSSLDLSFASQLTDLSPLKDMPLASLNLTGCTGLRELAPLEELPLKTLQMAYCHQVRDLSLLRKMKVTSLSLRGLPQLEDLNLVKGLPLTTLDIGECSNVRDLTPLQGMKLQSLAFNSCRQVRDLAPLAGMPLTSANLADCPNIHDLTPLKDMKLTEIYLTPRHITQGIDLLRQMRSLQAIASGAGFNDRLAVAEFWKRYEAGEFRK
jgi:serine/threonine protein kinase/DNA-directed RNA polymerase subunit RPC12/RpoP